MRRMLLGPRSRHAPDPLELTIRERERERVRRLLARLPEQQARLLYMRSEGVTHREMAEVLGLAPGSVGPLLTRAEVAFAALYEREEDAVRADGMYPDAAFSR